MTWIVTRHLRAGNIITMIAYTFLSTSVFTNMAFFSSIFTSKDGKYTAALKDVRAIAPMFLVIIVDLYVRSIA